MSATTTTRHHLPGSAVAAALACAAVIGGVSALGLAVSHHESVQPVAPAGVCISASCVGPAHPLLPGRHHRVDPPQRVHTPTGGGFKPTGDGGRVRAERP